MKKSRPEGSGPGCKSPASRRRGSGDWSAGRSAASRDGRRALIARSQDLPCPSRLDATRERREYSRRGAVLYAGRTAAAFGCGGFPIAAHPLRAPYIAGLRPVEEIDRARSGYHGTAAVARRSVTGTAEVARRSPTSPLRTASPTPVRSAWNLLPKERSPPACVGRRSMDGDARAMSPVGRVSGSRPINHGCSVRDPRPGSSSPTLRQLRSPFAGPWPTPRVAPGAPRPDVIRTLRPALQDRNGRVVPLRIGRRSMASAHR
jgi:hypothetical protein